MPYTVRKVYTISADFYGRYLW